MQSIYPLKNFYKIMEEIALNDKIKYVNYVNKISEGTISRILRPDTLFVKDSKTNYEEKINKVNIILNLTVFETNIMDKLLTKYEFLNTIDLTNFVSKNIDTIVNIINIIKSENDSIKIDIDAIHDSVDTLKDESLELNEYIRNVNNKIKNIIIVNIVFFVFAIICNLYYINYMNFKYGIHILISRFMVSIFNIVKY
jgi:hypothetical protein